MCGSQRSQEAQKAGSDGKSQISKACPEGFLGCARNDRGGKGQKAKGVEESGRAEARKPPLFGKIIFEEKRSLDFSLELWYKSSMAMRKSGSAKVRR